jgi:hypothetical protein
MGRNEAAGVYPRFVRLERALSAMGRSLGDDFGRMVTPLQTEAERY